MSETPAQQTDDEIVERLRGLSEAERCRLLVEHYRPVLHAGDDGWIARLEDVRGALALPAATVRSVCADLAWVSRLLGHPYPPAARSPSGSPALVGCYVAGYRLRYDFRFQDLAAVSQSWLQDHPGDSLLLAFAAFAALGARSKQGVSLYRQALDSPDADRRTRHTCLAGMWLAYDVPDQAQQMLDLTDVMLAKGEADTNLYYRRASALRKLEDFDQAVRDIDLATSMLGAGDNMVHQDYMREREMIVASQEIRAYVRSLGDRLGVELAQDAQDKIDEASRQLAERIDAAQRVVSDGLLKIVEILGLFVALVGFVAGSGAAVIRSKSVNQQLTGMALALLGSVIFFVLLRLVTTYRRK